MALEHLEKAEQIEQDFYSKNKVLIAQILVSLNRDLERAKSLLVDVLQKYKDSPKWDDIEVQTFNFNFIFTFSVIFFRLLKMLKRFSRNLGLKQKDFNQINFNFRFKFRRYNFNAIEQFSLNLNSRFESNCSNWYFYDSKEIYF